MRVLVLALGAVLLSGCALLKRDGDDKPAAAKAQAPTIYDLDIEAPRELRALLTEHLDVARYQRWPDEDLSSAELTRLATATPAQARALLETEGYFNAEVLVERVPGHVGVTVKAGPRSSIGGVTINFEGEPPPEATQSAWRRSWTLPAGEPFSQSRWSSAKAALLTRASADGYPLARWDRTEAVVDAEHSQVALDLTLVAGPRFRLGELRIEGLKHHDEELVRRLAGFHPGDLYEERTLLDFQERLTKTQLFDGASVELIVEPDKAGAAPVLVRLREAPRKQATTGIGYDANTGQRITLEYLDRLPLGYPLRARSKLILGRDQRVAELELSTHPKEDLTRNLASLQIEQDRSGDQIVSNLSARLGRLRERDAQDERLVYTELLSSRETQASGPAITGRALSANVQWIRRRLDSLLLPTEGHQGFLLLGAGRADNSVAENGPFGKFHLKLYGYRPLGKNWFGNARIELGQVFAADSVGLPTKLRFRAGGDDSVRGYAYQSLGPLVNGEVAGGRVVATGSLEVARPILADMPSLWGAVFVDAGNAAQSWRSFGKPAIGYGFGVRWRSPVGPLRVDIARAQETGRWRLGFSVGFAL